MSKNMADRIAYDWSELAFASKKPLSSLNAVMIAPPRKISGARIAQLLKEYLPMANIIFGISKEVYVEGFEGQPQFEMLDYKTAERAMRKRYCHRPPGIKYSPYKCSSETCCMP